MPPETCQEHIKMIEQRAKTDADISIIKNDVSYIRNTVCKHIDEGEKEGGHRDVLRDTVKKVDHLEKLLEKLISETRQSKWQSGAIGGVVVFGLTKSPEIGHILLSFITKIVFAGQ